VSIFFRWMAFPVNGMSLNASVSPPLYFGGLGGNPFGAQQVNGANLHSVPNLFALANGAKPSQVPDPAVSLQLQQLLAANAAMLAQSHSSPFAGMASMGATNPSLTVPSADPFGRLAYPGTGGFAGPPVTDFGGMTALNLNQSSPPLASNGFGYTGSGFPPSGVFKPSQPTGPLSHGPFRGAAQVHGPPQVRVYNPSQQPPRRPPGGAAQKGKGARKGTKGGGPSNGARSRGGGGGGSQSSALSSNQHADDEGYSASGGQWECFCGFFNKPERDRCWACAGFRREPDHGPTIADIGEDWDCPVCNSHNFAMRAVCKKPDCGTPRPSPA